MAEPRAHVTCQEVVELVTDYFDGTMGAEEAARFEQHLNFCDGCDWYVEQMRITVATVGRIGPADVPEGIRSRLVNAFREHHRS